MVSFPLIWSDGEPVCIYLAAAAKLLQSCPILCGPIDGSSPGSVVPGILQARTLEWVAIASLDYISYALCIITDIISNN